MSRRNAGWKTAFAGFGINFALGVLYAWSVIAKGIPDDWGWSETDKSWPYALCCLVFCLVMVPAGRLQERIGPARVARIGGTLVALGLVFASLTNSPFGYAVGFGVLGGAGVGLGYAAATPPALRWFASSRTGTIAGIVVSGFALASVLLAPLAHWLIELRSVHTALAVLGVVVFAVATPLARLLRPPPANHIPFGEKPQLIMAAENEFFRPGEMLSTGQFYALWFMYACAAGAGLMVIGKLATIAFVEAGIERGFLLVVALAIGNGAGRILAGMHSDRIGRKWTFCGVTLCQAAMIALLSQVEVGGVLAHPVVIGSLAAAIGANYGANLTLFPAITREFFGARHFGMNYGLLFTAWGVGGFMLALLAGEVYDASGSFRFAYLCSIGLLVAAATVTLFVHPPRKQDLEPPELVTDNPIVIGT